MQGKAHIRLQQERGLGTPWLCTASRQPHQSPYREWPLASLGLWSAACSLAGCLL